MLNVKIKANGQEAFGSSREIAKRFLLGDPKFLQRIRDLKRKGVEGKKIKIIYEIEISD